MPNLGKVSKKIHNRKDMEIVLEISEDRIAS